MLPYPNLTPETPAHTIDSVNPPPISRRRFFSLSAGVGAGLVLASCGGSSSGTNGSLQVVKRFPQDVLVPGKIRLPMSLADTSGILPSDSQLSLPQTLTADIINSDTGEVVVAGVTATRHQENLSTPYWPFTTIVKEEGIYTVRLKEVPNSEVSIQVLSRDGVSMPMIGDALPPFDTPTTNNARGVDPICTRAEKFCPFHSLTLTEALQQNKPVVYLIGTPAYCSTGTCSPGLEALITVAKSVGDAAVFVHADVYADRSATNTAPAVKAYSLSYEPVLYITNSDGTIVDRLDAVFDVNEIRDVLAANGIS